jgi:alginate O-acetyltransferase complex protein AlgI
MLGYRFPINFRHPYLSTSLSDFWRRWHMTLSRWLRDYLYISLGGSRGGTLKTSRNLIITMLLGGLWHGAAWTFVLWGLLHGLALVVERFFRPATKKIVDTEAVDLTSGVKSLTRLGQHFRIAVNAMFTLSVVLAGWVLFRSESLDTAVAYLLRMLTGADGIDWFPPLAIAAIACLVAEHLLWLTRFRPMMRLPFDAWYSPILTAIMVWVLLLYAPVGFRPFVYFQF